jgi:alkyl hydroperoxide reductase subunit AhpC
MKKEFFTLALALIFSISSFAADSIVGSMAPSFEVKSGDNRKLSLDDIKGKVTVLFYETKDIKEKNRKLKNELNKFYDSQPQGVKENTVRLAVVNCKSVIFTGAWKSTLRENSKKEGITIYGDWNGKMGKDYNVKDNESNVILIDKKGIIRYYHAGLVDDKGIVEIKNLLSSLGGEK